ncbi:hypothetical protein [Shewanella halifaxensis]|uniref:hypothetical protein n=1 Tax=Shewanella halifaxensis TaxID=271098 RepID=UPI000D594020|nr:hypothetical protein [Shewanella halifaxensis]
MRVTTQLVNDSCVHPVKCPKGHEFVVIYKGAKFEVLFDIAMHAITSGFGREAVSSFASSLERFYEFYIRFALFTCDVSEDAINGTWKEVKSQSERQLGAFIFSHLLMFKEKPVLLPTKMVTFRNNVIHKGYIPTIEESLAFGEAVHGCIMSLVKRIEENQDAELLRFYLSNLPKNAGYEWEVSESPKAISLNQKSCSSDNPKGTRCKSFSDLMRAYKIQSCNAKGD